MAARVYATIGRAPDNDVVLDDPTVSNHHARLAWSGAALVVEDLSSANGTFIDGTRIQKARTRVGADVRIGQVALPWSHQGLRALLKSGGGARTMPMPPGGVAAASAPPRRRKAGEKLYIAAMLAATAALAGVWYARREGTSAPTIPTSVERVEETLKSLEAAQQIGSDTASKIAKAFTPMDSVTRNAAVKIAARTDGPFHVEQVAEIWSAVRDAWKYVNDPTGQDYFATASETIQNGYIGDCDDFAITLASMVTAIGGKARVVIMDGPRGGHAYAEACVQGEPTKVASALNKHYRARWRRYLSGRAPSQIAFRTSDDCPIWLNLDWSSAVPGGAYEPEQWAVAVYIDGHSEPLTPAGDANATKPAAEPSKPASEPTASP